MSLICSYNQESKIINLNSEYSIYSILEVDNRTHQKRREGRAKARKRSGRNPTEIDIYYSYLFSIVVYIIFINRMENGRKNHKRQQQPYLQVNTLTETNDLPQNMSLNPTSHMDLNLQTTQPRQQEETLRTQTLRTIRNLMNSSLITARRVRKKKTSHQSLSKQSLGWSSGKGGKDLGHVKKIIKVTDLIRLFLDKIRMNSVFRNPVQYDPYQSQFNFAPNQFILQIQKIQIPKIAQNIFLTCKIIFIVAYIFLFPLTLIFQEVNQSQANFALKIFAIFFSFIDIIEICQQNTNKGRNISLQQFKRNLATRKKGILTQAIIISMTVLSLLIAQVVGHVLGELFFIAVALNIKNYLNQSVKLQDHLFTITHHERYWQICKVICLNLSVCHLLACILIGVASIRPNDSWMVANDINQAPWFQQYIWSYYFGTTIILTIGFGDLHPANWIEAFFIIIISFCACVFFGYNINYIGNLINLIKQDEVEKDSKLKVISSLAKKTSVSTATLAQITNYIVQSSKIKKQSNFTQQKDLIQQLPEALRSSFLAQANQKIFNHLTKMIRFTNKTIQKLSLNIEAKICHPDQMLKRKNDDFSLMILQSGEVGFVAHLKESRLHSLVIERISNTIEQQSKLICVDILKNEHINYDIKSLAYSIVYEMKKGLFEECLKCSKEDYQIYRLLLDKCRYRLNECGIMQCRFCQNQFHTLFECPKLHYKPFQKHVPYKSKNLGAQKQSRVKCIRNKQLINYYDLDQAIILQPHLESSQSISQSESLKDQTITQPREVTSGRRMSKSLKRTNPRQSFFMTLEMVTKLRQDIQNLKSKSFDQDFKFTFWDCVDCDQVYNFKYYFPQFNFDQYHQKQIKNNIISTSRSFRKKYNKKPY